MAAHLLAKIRCLTNDSPFIRLPLWNFFVTQKHCVKNEENSLRGRGALNISRLEFSILIRTFESILWNLQFSGDVKFKSIPFSRGFDLELEERTCFKGQSNYSGLYFIFVVERSVDLFCGAAGNDIDMQMKIVKYWIERRNV